jgi:hypothetical protein
MNGLAFDTSLSKKEKKEDVVEDLRLSVAQGFEATQCFL